MYEDDEEEVYAGSDLHQQLRATMEDLAEDAPEEDDDDDEMEIAPREEVREYDPSAREDDEKDVSLGDEAPADDPDPVEAEEVEAEEVEEEVEDGDDEPTDDDPAIEAEAPEWLKGLSDSDRKIAELAGDDGEATAQRLSDAAYFEEIAAPYEENLKRFGMNKRDAFRDLMRTNDFASSNPVEYLRWYADQLKLTPAQIGEAFGVPATDDDEGFDPFAPDNAESQAQPQPQRPAPPAFDPSVQTTPEISKVVERFTSAKGEDGQSAYPHFETVAPTMTAILQQRNGAPVTMASLQDAYTRAVRADPVLFEQEQAQIEQRAAAKQQAEADKAALEGAQAGVKKARKASKSIVSSGVPKAKTTGPDASGDLRGYLASQLGG